MNIFLNYSQKKTSNYEKLIKMYNFFNFLKIEYLSDNDF